MNQPPAQPAETINGSLTGLFLRLFWMLLGPMLLLGSAGRLGVRTSEPILWWSLLFWLVAGGILVARYFDIRHFEGYTVDGGPADFGHWKRHAAGVVALSIGAWTAGVWLGQ